MAAQVIVFLILGLLIVAVFAVALFHLRHRLGERGPGVSFASSSALHRPLVIERSCRCGSRSGCIGSSDSQDFKALDLEYLNIQLTGIGRLWRWSVSGGKTRRILGQSRTLGDAILTTPRTVRSAGDVKLVKDEAGSRRRRTRYRLG